MLSLCHYNNKKENSDSHKIFFRRLDNSDYYTPTNLSRSITDLVGSGKNKEEAIADLREQVKEYYKELDALVTMFLDTSYFDYYSSENSIIEINET